MAARPGLAALQSQALSIALVAIITLFQPSARWSVSGAPLLMCLLIAAGEQRMLASVPLWALVALIHSAYTIVAPSWILRSAFTAACWPTSFVISLYQFPVVSGFVRRHLRKALLRLQFTADMIALFDLPALEIDQDVDGLLVIRGITVSLSSLTITVHGVEVGIKLTNDLELALATDQVVIKFFRNIEVDHIYGNVKGGEREMDFYSAKARGDAQSEDQPFFNKDTEMLSAARSSLDLVEDEDEKSLWRDEDVTPQPESVPKAFEKLNPLNLDDGDGAQKYQSTLQDIEETSVISKCRRIAKRKQKMEQSNLESDDEKGMRAAICTEMHHFPTILHPPANSIRVTTLKYLSPPYVRRFLHRLPLLLRVLLNALSYFHPVTFSSITVGGSGQWISVMLDQAIFKEYAESGSDITNLRKRILRWLSNAKFCLQLVGIKGLAQVPIDTSFDINSRLNFDDILLYRTLPSEARLQEVVRLGGADATVNVPSYLLPHHEHLLPPDPSTGITKQKEEDVKQADGQPQTVLAERELKRVKKDDCNVVVSSHVRLPVCFHQELLEFVAALVKATKIVEIERDSSEDDDDDDDRRSSAGRKLSHFTSKMKGDLKHGLHKATVNAVVNDRFIARLVYKIMRKLETAQGDVGYSGEVPVPLKPYRDAAEPAAKLLP